MQALCILLTVALATTASAASFRPHAREIPIYEEDAVPGVADQECGPENTLDFSTAVAVAADDCSTKTDYEALSPYLATPTQRFDICSCSLLANQLQEVAVPRCYVIKDDEKMSLAESIDYAFQDCFFDESEWQGESSTDEDGPNASNGSENPSGTSSDSTEPTTDNTSGETLSESSTGETPSGSNGSSSGNTSPAGNGSSSGTTPPINNVTAADGGPSTNGNKTETSSVHPIGGSSSVVVVAAAIAALAVYDW